jgi:hypothetical protein
LMRPSKEAPGTSSTHQPIASVATSRMASSRFARADRAAPPGTTSGVRDAFDAASVDAVIVVASALLAARVVRTMHGSRVGRAMAERDDERGEPHGQVRSRDPPPGTNGFWTGSNHPRPPSVCQENVYATILSPRSFVGSIGVHFPA